MSLTWILLPESCINFEYSAGHLKGGEDPVAPAGRAEQPLVIGMKTDLFGEVQKVMHPVPAHPGRKLTAAEDVDPAIRRMHLGQPFVQGSRPFLARDRAVIGRFGTVVRAEEIGIAYEERPFRTLPGIRKEPLQRFWDLFSLDSTEGPPQPFECHMSRDGRDKEELGRKRGNTLGKEFDPISANSGDRQISMSRERILILVDQPYG